MIGSIVLVGALTHCALLHPMCDLKVVQINMQSSLIQEFMLYKFELGYKAMEVTKNICYVNGEDAVDLSTVTRLFKQFNLDRQSLANQARSGRPKTLNYEAVL